MKRLIITFFILLAAFIILWHPHHVNKVVKKRVDTDTVSGLSGGDIAKWREK